MGAIVLLFVLTAAMQIDEGVQLTKAEYLTLMIKDRVNWHVGMWEDRVDTKVAFTKAGERTVISVNVDHPNGVDLSKYAASYVLLEDAARRAAEGVLEGRGWQDDYDIVTMYSSRP